MRRRHRAPAAREGGLLLREGELRRPAASAQHGGVAAVGAVARAEGPDPGADDAGADDRRELPQGAVVRRRAGGRQSLGGGGRPRGSGPG